MSKYYNKGYLTCNLNPANMKKSLLLIFLFSTFSFVYSQNLGHILRTTKAIVQKNYHAPSRANNSQYVLEKPEKITEIINGRAVSYIPIGQSPNSYSINNNSSTQLWADNNLNSLVFTHRVDAFGDTMNVGYDVSFDGGITWSLNNKTNITGYNGHLPKGGIINPAGNTNPDNAYYNFGTRAANSATGSLTQYLYGANQLTNFETPNFLYDSLESNSSSFVDMSDAFTITQQGVSWYVGAIYTTDPDYIYNGQLRIGNTSIIDNELVYHEYLMDFLAAGDEINDIKVAFSPDGQTGYICVMSDSQSDPQPYNNYHPILLKTEDGGVTWSDPIHVNMGGIGGVESIKYYWSDELIESIDIYGVGFNRDEVYYNMGYQCDIVVDAYGDPHLTGLIALATSEGWFPSEGSMATWHIFSPDGGATWDATALYDNIFFDGEVQDITMYNTPYIASDMDGDIVFFSWIDTDLDGAEANTNPNIFVVAHCVYDGIYTDVDNVTELSMHWFKAFFGGMSQYVFGDYDLYDIEIPLVFLDFTVPGDPLSPIQYWYIDGFTLPIHVKTMCFVGINENESRIHISQNSPNPAINNTTIKVNSENTGVIDLEISSITGHVIHSERDCKNALIHTFSVNVNDYKPGLYFYSIAINGELVTKKMIVQ